MIDTRKLSDLIDKEEGVSLLSDLCRLGIGHGASHYIKIFSRYITEYAVIEEPIDNLITSFPLGSVPMSVEAPKCLPSQNCDGSSWMLTEWAAFALSL